MKATMLPHDLIVCLYAETTLLSHGQLEIQAYVMQIKSKRDFIHKRNTSWLAMTWVHSFTLIMTRMCLGMRLLTFGKVTQIRCHSVSKNLKIRYDTTVLSVSVMDSTADREEKG